MNNMTTMKLWVIFSFILITTGCAGVHPLSNYARTGDTVMIALGGEHIRTSVAVLKKENISVTITDSGNNTYPVKLRHLMKVTADLGSDMNYSGLYSGTFSYGQGAYQGMWLGIVDLIDPVNSVTPPLSIGAATLRVSGEGLIATIASEGNGDITNIPIEILPGQGTPNPLNTYTFTGSEVHPTGQLEPVPQIDISPAFIEGMAVPSIAGASFKLQYVEADFNNNARPPRAIPATQDPNVHLSSSYEAQGDGTSILKIFVTNPRGFNTTNDHTGLAVGKSDLHSLSVRLIWNVNNQVVTDNNWQSSIQLLSGEYIDMNGDLLTEVTPAISKVR